MALKRSALGDASREGDRVGVRTRGKKNRGGGKMS